LKYKNKYFLIRKFNLTSNEKNNYHHPIFVQYKKNSYQFISSLPYEKQIRKNKKIKTKKHKIGNILKGKRLWSQTQSHWVSLCNQTQTQYIYFFK
jgi:delta-aminolevulinic acid dehydratase/porphobilinogen synthase